MNNQIRIEMPSYIVPYRSTRHSNNNNLTVSMENNESVIRRFGNSFSHQQSVFGILSLMT